MENTYISIAILDGLYFTWSGAHSRIQELGNNLEMKNPQNKGHRKISESTVLFFLRIGSKGIPTKMHSTGGHRLGQ